MRILLRHASWWGLGLVSVWIIVTIGLLQRYPQARKSFAVTTGNFSVVTVILSPLCCAVGIAYGARLRRSGVVRTSQGWPRSAASTIIATWVAVTGAVLLVSAAVTTGILALLAAGRCDPRLMVGPLLTALAATAFLTFGAFLGVVTGSYLFAAVDAIGIYVLIATIPVAGDVLIGWSGPAAIDGTPDHLEWHAIALWTGLDLAVIVTSLLLVTMVMAPGGGRWWLWVCSGILAAAIAIGAGMVAGLEDVWKSSGDWRCRSVGGRGSMACVSGDVSWRLDEYATAVGRVDDLLGASGGKRPLLYAPQGGPNRAGYIPVRIPVSTSSSPSEWATYFHQPLLADNLLRVNKSNASRCDGAIETLDDALVSVMDGQSFDPSSLRSMVSLARACG